MNDNITENVIGIDPLYVKLKNELIEKNYIFLNFIQSQKYLLCIAKFAFYNTSYKKTRQL